MDWSLVWVDSSKLRHRLRRAYQKARKDIERAKILLNQYESVDLPSFERWLRREFGSLLSEERELIRKFQEMDSLRREVERETFVGRVSISKAYQKIMAARNSTPAHEETAEENTETPIEEEDSGFNSKTDGWQNDYKNKLRAEFFEKFGFDIEDDPNLARMFAAMDLSNPPRPDPRIKDIYRALVRLLHPDIQKEMTPQKLEWWHQVQEAYNSDDVHQLETILTLCTIETEGFTATTNLTSLMQVTQEFKKTLYSIKRHLTQCRREPAWDFSKNKNVDALRVFFQRSLSDSTKRIRVDIEQLENLFSKWAKIPAEPRGYDGARRSSKKQSFPHDEFLF